MKAAGGSWGPGEFDDRYYKTDDPVAGPNGTDPNPSLSRAVIAVDVVPAAQGRRSTFTIRTLADALPGHGTARTPRSTASHWNEPPARNEIRTHD